MERLWARTPPNQFQSLREAHSMAPQPNPIRRCTKPGCTNMTRGSRQRLSEHPLTLVRMTGGVCAACHQLKEMRCEGCQHPMRPTSVPANSAPGTKCRFKEGMCKPCWFAANKEASMEPESQVTEEGLEYTRRGLDSFLVRRRERMERWAA